ncbi:MAG: diadenylate cyclase CdaA [Marinilabiliales bacterium]
MITAFITLRVLDVIDIVLVAVLLYNVYMLIRGTVAISIFIGIFSVYLFWLVVKALNMQLLSTILGQFMGVGMIALIIVFQQEIRRFLLLIGSRYKLDQNLSLKRLMSGKVNMITHKNIEEIVNAVSNMSKSKTGALIVITKNSELPNITARGDILDARISSRLIENIFVKNSPLHDGALVIVNNIIKAARCILPISEKTDIPPHFGLRHRAALGISETTDAIVIVVSEETGKISFVKEGKIKYDISNVELTELLHKEF